MSKRVVERANDQARSRTPLVIGIALAVVAVIAVAAIALSGGGDDGDDATVVAPPLVGADYDGNEVEVVPGEDGPLMLVFLAHWCPHCNDEIPVLQEWQASGEIPDDLSIVGVSTAVEPDAPNYPPAEWIDAVGWEWPVLADDDGALATEYEISRFPTMIFLDADGAVTARVTGELPIEELQTFADVAVA